MKKLTYLILWILTIVGSALCPSTIVAQVAFQGTVKDPVTGNPRMNESVIIELTIEDSKGNIIHSENQPVVTNELGLVSLYIGDENSFANADWNNLPFTIHARVDNVIIGETPILSVPVAEYAKRSGPYISREYLCSKIWGDSHYYYEFYLDGTCKMYDGGIQRTVYCKYNFMGNKIFIYNDDDRFINLIYYVPFADAMTGGQTEYLYE